MSKLETRKLLACGIVAGPLFLVVTLVQAYTRRGFDLARHPISLLSLGDLGWLQITNFVVAGILYLACAIGLRRALEPGRGATWGPRLVGAAGVGLIVAGVFVTDAGAGYPPGAPAGAPLKISWHGVLHEVGFLVTTLGMIIGCLVLARRFAALRRPGWVAVSSATPGGGPRPHFLAGPGQPQRAPRHRHGHLVRLRRGHCGASPKRAS
jgi:Protein of unknown function (DUF998)